MNGDPQDASRERIPVKYRSLLGRYAAVIVIIAVMLALAGVYVTYTAQTTSDTITETDQVTTATWTVDSSFDHGAVVQRDTAVLPEGERLTGLPSYFTTLAPHLDGTYQLSNQGDVEDVSGEIDLNVVLQHVAEGDDDEIITYWEERESLDTEVIEDGEGGHSVDFEFNVTELDERVSDLEDQVGASPGTSEVLLVADTTLVGVVDGQEFVDERTSRLEIEPGAGTYSVEAQPAESDTHEAIETVENEVPNPDKPSTPMQAGAALLILLGIVGAGSVGYLTYAGYTQVSDKEREYADFENERDTFDKWISTGKLPDGGEYTRVELDSLADVVDVAIDSNRRVIESTGDRRLFVTLVDGTRYEFEPPEQPASKRAADPLDDGDTPTGPIEDGDSPDTEAGDIADGEGSEEQADESFSGVRSIFGSDSNSNPDSDSDIDSDSAVEDEQDSEEPAREN